jgi:hypothetical protein
MKLQVTKAQNIDQMGSALKNERYSDPCSLRIQSYIHGMELQVTKVKTGKYDAIRSYKINASSSDTCNLRIQSYIYGEGRKEKKVIQMFNTKQNNMNNVQFKPEGQLKEMQVQFNNKTLGRPVNPNSARQQRLASAPGVRTGRPVNLNSVRQQRIAELDAKRANGTLQRGRPVNPASARQVALRAAAMKMLEERGLVS